MTQSHVSPFARRLLAPLLLAASLISGVAGGAISTARGAENTGCVSTNYGDGFNIGCSAEQTWNYSISQIKAPAAWSRGFAGAGVTVALFDSGIDTGDNQFIGRISPTPGYDATTNTYGVTTDDMWHGTFVAGIIAADRDGTGMTGVAFNAQLLPIRIVNPDGSITLSDAQLAKAITYAIGSGAKVFNNSWNSSTPISQLPASFLASYMPQTLSAYQAAVKAGAI
ncbi:MAG: S8 family serine peptidase, partial [Acidobacteriota bacterium]